MLHGKGGGRYCSRVFEYLRVPYTHSGVASYNNEQKVSEYLKKILTKYFL